MTHQPVFATPPPKLRLELPADIAIADQIVLTITDCCAAGPRALHALQATPGFTVQRAPCALATSGPGPLDLVAATCGPSSDTQAPLQVVTLLQAGQPKVTFLCLNAAIPASHVSHVVVALTTWLQLRGATLAAHPLVLAAAAILPTIKTSGGHVLSIAQAAVPQGLAAKAAPLPPSTKLADNLLATLTHALHAAGLPSVCLLVPGYKPSVLSGLEDSVSTVLQLAGLLEAGGYLPASAVTEEGVRGGQLLHRWFAEVNEGGGEVMYT